MQNAGSLDAETTDVPALDKPSTSVLQAVNKTLRIDIEFFRCLAAFAIICAHNQSLGSMLGTAGLVFFVAIAVYFAGKSKTKSPWERAKRLMPPWIIWFVIFWAFRALSGKLVFEPGLNPLEAVLFGSAAHLWFLPYLLVALMLLDEVRQHVSARMLGISCGVLAVALLAMTPLWREPSMAIGKPWAQWMHATPALLMGVFLANFKQMSLTIAKSLALAMLVASACMANVYNVGLPYFIGIAVCVALVFWPAQMQVFARYPAAATLSKYAFGVYLIHPLFLAAFARLGLHGVWWVPAVVFPLSVFVAIAISKAFPAAAKYAI